MQIVALAMAGGMLWAAFLLTTTGRPWLFAECSPQYAVAYAYLSAAWHAVIGLGLIGAAIRDPSGPRLRDPLLLALVLAFAGLTFLEAGAMGVIHGSVWLGPARRCIEITAPFSYPLAGGFLIAGTVALYGAAAVGLQRRVQED